jgi:hypothetical protein
MNVEALEVKLKINGEWYYVQNTYKDLNLVVDVFSMATEEKQLKVSRYPQGLNIEK